MKNKTLTGLVLIKDTEKQGTLFKTTRCLMDERDIILQGRPVKLKKLAEAVQLKTLSKEIEIV